MSIVESDQPAFSTGFSTEVFPSLAQTSASVTSVPITTAAPSAAATSPPPSDLLRRFDFGRLDLGFDLALARSGQSSLRISRCRA